MSVENASGERTEPLDLAALRALCDAATPGPWKVDRDDEVMSTYVRSETVEGWKGEIVEIHTPDDVWPDFEFIVAARSAVPALLDELATVRAELADADRRRFEFEERTSSQVETLRAEVERLTSAEGGIRDAAIAYVRAAESDRELVEGGLYRDLRAAVDHWDAVTARLEAAAESSGGTR